MKKQHIIKLASTLLLATLLPTQMSANDPSVNYLQITPEMVGITTVSNDLSVSDVDVSSHFNLVEGSIKVSFTSVDVIKNGGHINFALAGDGDNSSTWHIDYSTNRSIKLNHGGILAGGYDDIMVSNDAQKYTFESTLIKGFKHETNGNKYFVHNNKSKKLKNGKPFTWISNEKAKSFDFDISTNADSRSGKGSSYTVFVDNAEIVDPCAETTVCADTHYSMLTPAMFDITSVRKNISVANVDVSAYFNLEAGSVKVSFSNVATYQKNGNLRFALTDKGDDKAQWDIVYAEKRPIKISHGGKLAPQKVDGFLAQDRNKYQLNDLSSEFVALTSGNYYGVLNRTKKFAGAHSKAFEWTSTGKSTHYKFQVSTNAKAGRVSSYTIYIDDSTCETVEPQDCGYIPEFPIEAT